MTTAITTADLTDLATAAYRDALGDPALDADSDFFESGGDSLSAFQITARLESALGVDVPVALVFAYPSPADLASVVEQELEVG
ncbi:MULTISPECIES: acyl carrier protein [Actinosynnema]|uniref:acyl carrier protein n=1 Tax=Actinosynnema TaxID=40566 RepID=UPI0020A2A86E|nr:acyl carrier protein [Actinosynnema pretiosum]MCP2096330.1 Phosphopantetheine attachment site [Actinosynnema pretiosum]